MRQTKSYKPRKCPSNGTAVQAGERFEISASGGDFSRRAMHWRNPLTGASAIERVSRFGQGIDDHVPVLFGGQVRCLAWPVLGGASDENGLEAIRTCGSQVGVMRSHHGDAMRRQAHCFCRLQVGLGHRFVGAGDLRADDDVPGQSAEFSQVEHSGDVSVR